MNKILVNIQRVIGATDEEIKVLEQNLVTKNLEKGAYFLKAGEVCNYVGFLEKGSMRLFYDSPKKEACCDFYFENSFVGSFASFMGKTPSMVNIAAIEPCELLLLKLDAIDQLSIDYPVFKKLVYIIIQEQFYKLEKREESLLILSPEERFNQLVEMHPKIFKRIPLHYVASYLAITAETLSRYRAKAHL